MKRKINLSFIFFLLKRKGLLGLVKKNEITKIKEEDRAYKFIKKNFYKSIKKIDSNCFKQDVKSNYIWFCWLDGIENSPELIQECYKSLLIHNSSKKIVEINRYNFSEYIDLPKYIIEKWKNGIIMDAHFSDIIRVCLLSKYGGVWSDSTCYYTKEIPKYLYEQGVFLFSNERKRSKIKISNWFIISNKDNLLINQVKEFLFDYWKKYDAPIHYFFMHLYISLIYEKNNLTNKDYLFISNMNALSLNHELVNKFDSFKFDIYRELSFVHKLNRKNIINDNVDTFYNVLIKK